MHRGQRLTFIHADTGTHRHAHPQRDTGKQSCIDTHVHNRTLLLLKNKTVNSRSCLRMTAASSFFSLSWVPDCRTAGGTGGNQEVGELVQPQMGSAWLTPAIETTRISCQYLKTGRSHVKISGQHALDVWHYALWQNHPVMRQSLPLAEPCTAVCNSPPLPLSA